MNKLLTMFGLAIIVAVLTLGCDSAPSASDAGAANSTTLASISPENKATAVYGVTGMT